MYNCLNLTTQGNTVYRRILVRVWVYKTCYQGYKTLYQSQTQTQASWLVNPEHTLSINQSTCLSLRFEQSFVTSGPEVRLRNSYGDSYRLLSGTKPSEMAHSSPASRCKIALHQLTPCWPLHPPPTDQPRRRVRAGVRRRLWCGVHDCRQLPLLLPRVIEEVVQVYGLHVFHEPIVHYARWNEGIVWRGIIQSLKSTPSGWSYLS